MSLDIDKEKMTIMGIAFENRSVFKSVWYALSTNMIEGWRPTVRMLKNYEMKLLLWG